MPATSRFMRSALALALASVSIAALHVSPAVAKDPDQTLEDLLGVQPEADDTAKGRTLTIVTPEPVAPALEMPDTAAATQASVVSDPSLVLKPESPDTSVAPVAKAPAAPTRTPVAASSEPAAAVAAAAKSPADRMPSTLLAELDGLPATAPQDVPARSPIGMPTPLPQLVSETLGDGRTAASAKAARPAQPAGPALPSATAAALGLDIDGAPANVFPEDQNRGNEAVSAADLLARSSAPASAEAAEPLTPAKPEKPRQPDVAAVKPPKPAKPAPEKPVASALEMPATAAATQASVVSDPSLVLKPESPDTSVAPVAKAPAAPPRTPVAASSEPATAVAAAAKSPADRMPSTLLAELVSETLGDGRTAASAKAARPAQPAGPALPSATSAALGLNIDGAPANVFPEDQNRGNEAVIAADLLARSSAPASAEAAEPVTPAKPEKPRQPDVAAVNPPKPAKPAPEKPVAEAPKPEPESEAAKPAAADTANATQTPEQPPAEDTSMPPIAQPSTARASEPGRTEGSATPRQLTAPANDTLPAPKTLASGELVGRITFPAFNSTPPLVVKDMIRDKILPTLRMNPTLRVQVSGFADWTPNGSVDASTAISQRRAENITRFLIEEGIQPGRLQTRGVGVDFLPGAARDRVDITAIEP